MSVWFWFGPAAAPGPGENSAAESAPTHNVTGAMTLSNFLKMHSLTKMSESTS